MESYVYESIDYGNDVIPPQIFFPVSRARLACVASISSRVIARKLEREQKKWKGEGEERRGNACPQTPSFLFLLSSQFSGRTRAETLATQASARLLHCCKLLIGIENCFLFAKFLVCHLHLNMLLELVLASFKNVR